MIPATTTRVQENTDEAINNQIRAQTERTIEYFSRKGGAAIDQRLEELDREWDVERLLETNAASLALGSRARRIGRSPILPAACAGHGISPSTCDSGVVPSYPSISSYGNSDSERD